MSTKFILAARYAFYYPDITFNGHVVCTDLKEAKESIDNFIENDIPVKVYTEYDGTTLRNPVLLTPDSEIIIHAVLVGVIHAVNILESK